VLYTSGEGVGGVAFVLSDTLRIVNIIKMMEKEEPPGGPPPEAGPGKTP
jgi:hypothetical protein